MSTVVINYSYLERSASNACNASSQISGYVNEIQKRIINPISNLSGSDSKGYTATAANLARQKITQLNEKAERFNKYANRVNAFISSTKSQDEYVSKRISEISEMYVGERTWYQKIGDFLYNTFCVDFANTNALTRFLTDCRKLAIDRIGNYLEKARDWFKYGEGKYVLNIITAGVSIVVAIASIVAIPFTGGTSALATIAAITTAISSIISIANAVPKIINNFKAHELYKSGNPGAARYYGNISSVSDYWKKTDMGDAKTNKNYEIGGKIIDTVEVISDTVGMVVGVADLGTVKDYRFKDPKAQILGKSGKPQYSFTYKNIKKNILHDMGFKYNGKPGKDAFNFVKNLFEDGYENKFKVKDKFAIPEYVIGIFKGAKITDNVFSLVSDVDKILDSDKLHEKIEGNTGLLSLFDATGIFDEYGTKTGSNIADVILKIEDWYGFIKKEPAASGA